MTNYSEAFLRYWQIAPLRWWERLSEEQKKSAYIFYLQGQVDLNNQRLAEMAERRQREAAEGGNE